MKMKGNVLVNSSTEKVWAFITNVENYDKWAPDAIEPKQTSEGPFGLGTTFSLKFKMGRRLYDISGEVTEFAPPSHMALRHKGGPFAMQEWFDIKAANAGAMMTHKVSLVPENGALRALFTLAGPVLRLAMKGQMNKELRALKQHVEAN